MGGRGFGTTKRLTHFANPCKALADSARRRLLRSVRIMKALHNMLRRMRYQPTAAGSAEKCSRMREGACLRKAKCAIICYNHMYFHFKKRQNRLFNAASSGVQNIPCFCKTGMDGSPGGKHGISRIAFAGMVSAIQGLEPKAAFFSIKTAAGFDIAGMAGNPPFQKRFSAKGCS